MCVMMPDRKTPGVWLWLGASVILLHKTAESFRFLLENSVNHIRSEHRNNFFKNGINNMMFEMTDVVFFSVTPKNTKKTVTNWIEYGFFDSLNNGIFVCDVDEECISLRLNTYVNRSYTWALHHLSFYTPTCHLLCQIT